MHTCQDLCILVYLLSDCAAGKLAEISMSQCLNVKSIFVLINMLHTISTLIHFVTLDYAVLLHILLGQTACIWAKAEKGPKSTTLFSSDALATSRGILTGGGSGASPQKKYIPACGAQHTQPLQGGNQFFLSICIVAKNKKTLILCLVLVICTSIVNMQELRWRPGLQKYLALVCNQQYYLSLHQSCVFRLL